MLRAPNAIPRHDTFNLVFQLLNPHAFKDCLILWNEPLAKNIGEIVDIDGKIQRRASNKDENLHYIVNAWNGTNPLLLGQ